MVSPKRTGMIYSLTRRMKTIVRHLFIVALLVTYSCKKGGQSSVEGIVYATGTQKVVAGVTVVVRKSHNGNQAKVIAQTTTDQEGHFKINYYHALQLGYAYTVCTEKGFASERACDNKKTSGVVLYN